MPEAHWDAKSGAVAETFGQHYQEVAAAAAKLAERQAAIPAKPEDYKVELKFPEGIQVPEGVKFDPAKDPRLPLFTKLAHERGWTNDDVNAVIALDAQLEIAAHNAAAARIVAEDKKLGEKAIERRAAVANWTKALVAKNEITADEAAAINAEHMDATAISLVEKLMAKINGNVPGFVPSEPSRPGPKSIAERMYPNLPSGLPPASARSA